jgi:HTH-like domain
MRRATEAAPSYRKAPDAGLLPLIRAIVDARPTYGYRRVWALLNRQLDTSKNSRGILIDVILCAVLRGGDHGGGGSRVFRYGRAAG